jgi:hypothetical protein
MHINSNKNSEQKTHNTTNDKGVHPSLGLHLLVQLPMDHLYYLIKVIKKMCFKMLKIPNRLLQWLQNIQKPLAGLFRHLVWPKIEEDRLPGSPPFKLVVFASTKCTLLGST